MRIPGTAGATPPAAGPALSSAASTDAEGQLRIDFNPPRPGAYRVTATTTLGGCPVSDATSVVIALAGRELQDPAAREDMLRSVAKASGGRYLGEVTSLPDLPVHPARVLRIGKHRDIELWSRGWVLALAVALLGAEWGLRRRYGYI